MHKKENFQIVRKDNIWHLVIKWSPLKRINEYKKRPDDRNANFYIIFNKRKKLLYIGKTYFQFTIDRVKQHGYKEGFISTGVMEPKNCKYSKKRVEDAESLLIYACNPKDNISKKEWSDLEDTLVENINLTGILPRSLFHGTCFRNK